MDYDTSAIGFSIYPHLISHDLINKNKNPKEPVVQSLQYTIY